ncbi:protein of unknown function [Shewanella benthica]|uniref:Uncharacterized protein n=1 Tax=Shewanella benthica TaxID=43661 RepID=A0A330M3Q8_9GAMM|nr:protein of unknown function [Shewanella benthica]
MFTCLLLESSITSGSGGFAKYNTIPYKYLVSSETLSFFNLRRIDEEMVIPF